jgi:hypothetical protein
MRTKMSKFQGQVSSLPRGIYPAGRLHCKHPLENLKSCSPINAPAD